MKKHILVLLPFALTITGCSGGLKKGSIFNEKFMKRNTLPEIISKQTFEAEKDVSLDIEAGASVDSVDEDLVGLTKDGNTAWYNLSTNKMVVPFGKYDNIGYGYTDSSNMDGRFFYTEKEVDGKNILDVYDEFANHLYSGEKDPLGVIEFDDRVLEYHKEDERFHVNIYVNQHTVAHAIYNVDLTLKEVISPEDYAKAHPYSDGFTGELYGHPELELTGSSINGETRYVFFNTKKGKTVSSFTVPDIATSLILCGDYFIYQIEKRVDERATKFDFFDGTNKFILETYRAKITNGKVSKIKTNFVLSKCTGTVKTLFNEKGVYKYIYAPQARQIDKNKLLSNEKRNVILDAKLNVVANLEGINFTGLEQYGDYYRIDKTVYDSKMKEVGQLHNMYGGYPHAIKINNQYGLVDHVGKVLVEPNYDSLTKVARSEEVYLLKKGNEWSYYRITDDDKAELITKISLDDYDNPTSTGASAYDYIVRKSDSKKFLFNKLTGQLTDAFELQTGDTPISNFNVERLNASRSVTGQMYKRGSEYRCVYWNTIITDSYPSFGKK